VYNRGKTLLAQKRPAEAAADLDKATTLKPRHAKAHQLFGDALYALKKEDDAALHWEIAERLRAEKNSNE
jgi:tetratricopeptide (TPR) repeat protein